MAEIKVKIILDLSKITKSKYTNFTSIQTFQNRCCYLWILRFADIRNILDAGSKQSHINNTHTQEMKLIENRPSSALASAAPLQIGDGKNSTHNDINVSVQCYSFIPIKDGDFDWTNCSFTVISYNSIQLGLIIPLTAFYRNYDTCYTMVSS